MELPQPRPFGTEGKKPTHDFLSLYSHSSFQNQDPRPPHGVFLKTHDFLKPLESVEMNSGKGENTVETAPPPSSVEHALPGGIGTYSISHISNFKNESVSKLKTSVYNVARASIADRDGEANKATPNPKSTSHSGGTFALWNESVVKEKGAMVQNSAAGEIQVLKEPAEKVGQWSSERQLQTPFIHSNSFSSQSSSKHSGQKTQSFVGMMKSAKGHQEEEEDDEEEFISKRDAPSQKGDLTVKVDGKSTDQKPVTPRSKHSATEQRRRSKINDRFQILRDLIPQSDQKRDKASFLLEVIEYIQFLQEKVNKYETAFPGWNQEPTKLVPWRNIRRPGETMIDHSQVLKNGPGPGLMFDNNIAITPPMLANAQNAVDADLRAGGANKIMDHHAGLTNKGVPMPISFQPNMLTPVVRGAVLAQPSQRPFSDADNMASQQQTQLWQSRTCTTDCPATSDTVNEQEEVTIEEGTISISSAYSQGLLNNLTQALQCSGVDLSQASISVQIDLGKRAVSRLAGMTSSAKEDCTGNQAVSHSKGASSGEDSDQASKRLKTERS
ncbi:PREDICTED: transcription factor BIM2 isoform X2 [Nelumbo nucifera]|uniref:BHLH domain-containing protein n=2 Tax=Nelumbo nucifera TaxID=4432 RepID=A0A822YLT2_NELNU|nr:PREDICTED: transcription factor BIM2 isoform X2 [Nelumbo nucifera]DAD35124.1 TPA_asm: hypothetical protein HUJ06_005764 [Nelumbo nucifera]